MIARTTFVWFYSFNSTCHIVPVVPFITQERKVIQTHVESKNQNTKRRLETKNIPYRYTLQIYTN